MAAESDGRAADVRAGRGSGDAAGGLRAVDEDDARCAGGDVAAAVGRDSDQLPLLLGGGRRRPGDARTAPWRPRRSRAGAERADRAVAEGDVDRVGGGRRGEVDARADRGARIVERDDGCEIVELIVLVATSSRCRRRR